MKLFWRGSDYNLILEKILDSKCFSSNSKSLILSMFYKVEEFYKDYQKVKNTDISKDDFLNLILDSIKKYCDNINFQEPDENGILRKNNVLAVTNEKERSILCYPTENSLLYAIADIMPKYFYVPENFEYKDSFQRLLVNGYNLDIYEVLSDFNGWSWDVNLINKKNFQDSLIYQNFVIMFGNSFMEEWKDRQNKDIESFTEIKKCFSQTNYLEYLKEYLVLSLTSKEQIKNSKILTEKVKKLEEMSNKIKYFESIKLSKLKYLKELEKITLILNNKDLIRKEYHQKKLKLTPEKRILTLGEYKKMLENRKEKVVNKIADLTYSMNPINYMNIKRDLESFIDINTKKDNKDDVLINIQKEFIHVLNDVCIETEEINSLKNLIYKIRYYRYLYITEDKRIKDISELNEKNNLVLKKVIQKLVDYQSIKKITNDKELNQEIIMNILDTKVINLEALRFEIDFKDDGIIIKTYEKEVFEKEFIISGNFVNKNFEIKRKKIYKLFI